ncbi:MAG: DUF4340 domain-containing protein [Candidatus Eisenbacteria bacterium]
MRIALLALLFAGGAWITTLQRRAKPAVESLDFGPMPRIASLERLVLIGAGDSLVVEARRGAYWVVHPIVDRASDEAMAEVLRQLNGLKAQRLLPESGGSAFGLEPPRSRLRAIGSRGEHYSLALGDSAAVASALYARAGGRIALIDAFTARRYFRPNLAYLRDSYPTALGPGPVDSIEVVAGTFGFAARRLSAEHWVTRYPRGLDLDPLPVNRAIQFLRTPTIRDYDDRSRDWSALGLDPPRALWILHQGGRADTVRIGHPTADQQAVRIMPSHRPVVALMGSDFFRDFVDGWPRLAECRLMSMPVDSVQSIEFVGRGAGFRRSEGGWSAHPSERAVEDTASFGRDLRNLHALRWREYPLHASTPRGDASIAIRLASVARDETLFFAVENDTVAYAKSTRRARWGVVSAFVPRSWRYRANHG